MHMCILPEKGPLVFTRFSNCFMIPQKLRISLVCYVLSGTESGLENMGLGRELASEATMAGLSSSPHAGDSQGNGNRGLVA